MKFIKIIMIIGLGLVPMQMAQAQEYKFKAYAEQGFLAVVDHNIQFGKTGTDFSYVRDGGQDVLLPVNRFSVDMEKGQNIWTLLYQPLDLISEKVLRSPLQTESTIFAAGTPMRFRYNFPYYRISWLHDFVANDRDEFALGLSMQVRNTTIEFSSMDGSQLFRESNVGLVPILKARGKIGIGDAAYLGFEADGFYAPVSYINGSDEEIVGAILDASLRAGYQLNERMDMFLNFRYLGGGAVGTNTDKPAPQDGYVNNWLHFTTVTLGIGYRFPSGVSKEAVKAE